MTFLVFVLVCLLPAAAFYLFSRGFDWLVHHDGDGVARLLGRLPGRRDTPAPESALDELGADLRRLTGEHAWLMRADVPGKATRLRAVQLAYDDTLLRAAKVLEVEVPDPPLLAETRLQAEAELCTHGFTW